MPVTTAQFSDPPSTDGSGISFIGIPNYSYYAPTNFPGLHYASPRKALLDSGHRATTRSVTTPALARLCTASGVTSCPGTSEGMPAKGLGVKVSRFRPLRVRVYGLQGYLAHKKQPSLRTLRQAYA